MDRMSRTCVRAGAASLGAAALFFAASARAREQPPPPGQAIYDAKCAYCHGAAGRGDGPAAPSLAPAPRDFTAGKFKLRTTETGSLPTDEDLIRTIAQGVPGTSMPGWQTFLSAAEIRAVAEYLKAFSPRFAQEAPKAVELPVISPANTLTLANGAKVYAKLQCDACHGADGGGVGTVATEFEDDWGQPLTAANLTEPWTFRGGSRTEDVYMRFRTGMDGTPMPAFNDAATSAELYDLANYVVSVGRKPAWDMTADELRAFYQKQDEDARKDPVARGKYLVDSMGCAACHTPIREDGALVREFKLAGGQKFRTEPFGVFVAANLTPDKATGIGNVSDDLIKRAINRGTRYDGTRMLPFPMPWASYANIKPADLDAIVAYLRSLAPISNRIPAPDYPNLASYLYGKFKMLVLQKDPPLYIFPGNAGDTTGGKP